MESFKEKLPIIIAVIIVIALMVGAYYFLVIHKDLYYTQIDNTKIQEASGSAGDMRYEYTLTAYNKNRKEKEVKFKTSRELREGAFLELEVMQIRGVVNWREVQANELPEDVKTAMNVE